MNVFYKQSARFFSNISQRIIKICIVGSGPAGFYSAQHIVKKIKNVNVDIIEKLPVPFGLVRFGVAPDHPEVKNVISTFSKTAEHPSVKFIGNVCVGEDVMLDDLIEAYDYVLLAYGSNFNRSLNIPGENLSNVIPARRIVGWYNGLPEDRDLEIDLSHENVAIIGQGNVAIDVARILLQPLDNLKKTDITQHALECLLSSKIKRVYLIGRRGPLQAAFTIKELREMLKLENTTTRWNRSDFECFLSDKSVIATLERPKKRIMELMIKSLEEQQQSNGKNEFKPLFYRSPLEIKEIISKVITLGVNKTEKRENGDIVAVLTEERETLEAGLIVTSVGYKSKRIEEKLPFDEAKGIVKNEKGKVDKWEGVYATGWVATGPMGVILTTMSNSFAVAEAICRQVQRNENNTINGNNKAGFESIRNKLDILNVQVVSWKDWLKIDNFEREEGKKCGKPREKIVDYKKMLEIAAS